MPLTVTLPNAARDFFALPPSDYVDARSLSAGVAESFAVPSGAKFAMFASTGDFYAAYDGTAAEATDISDGSASELNPTMRYISGKTNISVIAPSDCKITISFYMGG